MTKKLTWEVEKTSLVLRVTDGAKETTWKIRKNQGSGVWIKIFSEILNSLEDLVPAPWDEILPTRPMLETARTVDEEEFLEFLELQRYQGVQASSEEASRAAQAARVRELNIGAKWFEADDDDTYGVPIPDYDTGEVQ